MLEQIHLENLTDKFEREVRRRLDKIIGRRLWRRHRYGDVRTFSSYEFRDILRRTFRNISIETIRTAKDVAERKARWGGMSIRIGLPFEEELIRKVMAEYENTIPYQLERSYRRKLRKIMQEALTKNLSPAETEELMKKELGKILEGDLRRIARDEIKRAYDLIRERIYKLAEENNKVEGKYKWRTASDERTCKVCREVEERTKKGVSLEELKKIIVEVRQKYRLTERQKHPFFIHSNCRCTYLLVR